MEAFCSRHTKQLREGGGIDRLQSLPISSKQFLTQLNLPFVHPFCRQLEQQHVGWSQMDNDFAGSTSTTTTMTTKGTATTFTTKHLSDELSSIFPNMTSLPPPLSSSSLASATTISTALAPDMGPTPYPVDTTMVEWMATNFWYYVYPSFALTRIWIIFFAGYVTLLWIFLWLVSKSQRQRVYQFFRYTMCHSKDMFHTHRQTSTRRPVDDGKKIVSESSSFSHKFVPSSSLIELSPIVTIIGLVSSWVVLTDDGYVLEFGRWFGAILFLMVLLIVHPYRPRHFIFIMIVVLLSQQFISPWQCEDPDNRPTNVQSGLFYNDQNTTVTDIVSHWNTSLLDYSKSATPWQWTGDGRTGMSYSLNYVDQSPTFHRVWLPTVDEEYVALDISFPESGHDEFKPLYLVLHGLNGGSTEGYVVDFTRSRNLDGSTVVVMIARGLDDTPIQGWTLFHGARTSDAHSAAVVLRDRVKKPNQILAGVGYSLGSIVLNHYVSSSKDDVALDVSVSISGALACNYQQYFKRSQRIWQPVIVAHMKDQFFGPKWGYRLFHQLGRVDYQQLLRVRDIVESDGYTGLKYNGLKDQNHHDFYASMSSVLGPEFDSNQYFASGHFSIPHLVLQAFDDPISTWRTNGSNDPSSILFGSNLVDFHENLVVLLTEKGGHVGWPVGWKPHSWVYMNDYVAANFVKAYEQSLA